MTARGVSIGCNRRFALLVGAFFFTVSVSCPVGAFQVEFPENTFGIQGSNKTRHAILINKEDSLQAVEISMKTRSLDIFGNETLGDTTEFEVYPSQVLIAPGEDADVVIVWKGETPVSENAYRLEAKEVPFQSTSKFKTGALELTVGRRYLYAAYVTPPGARADIQLEKAVLHTNDQGEDELVVTLKNRGTAHKILSRFDLSLTQVVGPNDESLLASPQLVSDPLFQSRFNLLAGGLREFRIPWPKDLPKGELQGTLTNVR